MKKIAIIEDNPEEREVLKGLLKEMGYKVVAEGASAEDALKICARERPDVLIMDVNLPAKDGVTAAKEINEQSPVAIILVTGIEDEKTVKKAIKAGVMAYLIKPATYESLYASIEVAEARWKEFEKIRKENIDLKNTIEARKLIEKAKGLLMEKEKLSEKEAYSRIQRISMDKRKPMKDIAEVIISAFEKNEKTLNVSGG